jgi:hypothetical protein
MTEGIIADTTDNGTLRPNATPITSHGTNFTPMVLPDFDLQISLPYHALHSNPFSIFALYYTPQIVDLIVQYTNQNPRKAADPDRPNARANQ